MSTEENKAVVRDFYARYPDLDAALELLSDGFVLHGAGPGPLTAEDFKRSESMLVAAAPTARVTVEDQLAEGDKVASRWTWRGEFQSDWMGASPTGQTVTFTAMVIDRLVAGKIAERWVEADSYGLLAQVGIIRAGG